jgi:hypothetical protein
MDACPAARSWPAITLGDRMARSPCFDMTLDKSSIVIVR